MAEALRVAGLLEPHASVCGRHEALAQEYLGEFPEKRWRGEGEAHWPGW